MRKLMIAALLATGLLAAPGVGGAVPSPAEGRSDPHIVVLKDGVDPAGTAGDHGRRLGAEVRHLYRSALNGYAARIPAHRLAELRTDPRVAYVEADGAVQAAAQTLPWGIDRIDADTSSTLAGNGTGAVAALNAYVIDTGIATSHRDLNVVGRSNWTGDGRNDDCNGHGTHVAGTFGARDNAEHVVGAAPGVALTALKVLDCSGDGQTSKLIAAIDWTTSNARRPAVANLSLTADPSRALDDAVRRSAAGGVLYVVAAGNSKANACTFSPARAGAGTNNGIVTVAATDSAGREASFSNHGSCIDVWAPGVNILSTSRNGGTATMSGTSMASPHAAGAAGLYLSRSSTASPATAEASLKATARPSGSSSRDGRAIRIVSAGRY